MSLVNQNNDEPILGVYPEGNDDASPIVEITASGTTDAMTITINSYNPEVKLHLAINGAIASPATIEHTA